VPEFDTPAVVATDPVANTTDLLIERASATPQAALFAVPDGEGWREITSAEFLTQVRALA
jgi:long-chain acyl-CoA synthetase